MLITCNKSNTSLLLILSALSLIAADILASLLSINSMWGFNSLHFIAGVDILSSTSITIVVVLCYFIIVKSSNKSISRNTNLIWAYTILLSLSLSTSFWLLKTHTTFLGDGAIFISFIKQKVNVYESNLVDFFLHSLLYRSILLPNNLPPIYAYSIIGLICGILFLTIAILFTKTITVKPEQALYGFLLFAFSGFIVFYYGYVESYTILSITIIFYATSSIWTILNKKTLILPILAFLATVAIHQICILLAPSLVFLFYLRLKNGISKKEKTSYIVLAIILISVIILFFWLKGLSFNDYKKMLGDRGVLNFTLFLPFFSGSYATFSRSHILDLLNIQILASPIAFILLPVFMANKSIYRDPVVKYLLISAVFLFTFFFIMESKIGMFRDWDLFSLPSLLYTILFIYILVVYYYDKTSVFSKCLLLGALVFHSANWILLNHSKTASANRFCYIIENSNVRSDNSSLSHDYEILASFYKEENAPVKELSYLIKAANLTQNPRYFLSIGNNYAQAKDYSKAIYYYTKALETNPNSDNTKRNLAKVYYLLGQYDKVVTTLESYSSIDSLNPNTLYSYGRALFETGKIDSAINIFKKLLLNDPKNASIYNIIGTYLAIQGRQNEAIEYYQRAIDNNLGNHIIYRNMSKIYFKKDAFYKAVQYYNYSIKLGGAKDSNLENQFESKYYRIKKYNIPKTK